MKSPRNILKTIRIPQELYEVINNFEGSTWNDKINNLLEFYIEKDIDYKNHLNSLEKQIENKQQLLNEVNLRISKLQNLLK